MITCQKCQEQFPTIIVIDGKRRNLCNRKFCLTCSPFGKHNTVDITKPPIDYIRGSYKYVKNFRERKKQKAVEFLGGKCQLCGYDKHYKMLEFHHLDPNEKDFAISSKTSWGFSRIEDELKKCAVLCPNCHREVHLGLATI